MHTRVKLLGGNADVDHTQTIGGDTVKLLGGEYIPQLPPRASALLSKTLTFRNDRLSKNCWTQIAVKIPKLNATGKNY